MTTPLSYRFDGWRMLPVDLTLTRQHFDVGGVYQLVEHQARSGKSHRHYFACVNQAWHSLSEEHQDRFPTPEHLRKFALIRTGWSEQRVIVCATPDDAAMLVSVIDTYDQYSVSEINGEVVSIWTARSQSVRAMRKADFERSKHDVIDWVAAFIGVSSHALTVHAMDRINE